MDCKHPNDSFFNYVLGSGTLYFGVSGTLLFLDLLSTQMQTYLMGMKFGYYCRHPI